MKQSETSISRGTRIIYEWVKRKENWIECRQGHGLEWTALLLYVGLVAMLMVFHEPWFDEAQAWQIAKSASIPEILFEVPHFEGHPPLWHLILLPFAKSGIPFEWGIKIPNLLINTGAVALLLWKSPFSRPMKLALPFTFFLFYQYGVVSRNYCLLFLAFMLCAMTYSQKEQKPFCFCAALAMLCLSSLYGIAFAVGICLVWLGQLWHGKKFGQFLKGFWGSRTMFALLLLFLFNLGLVITLIPRSDTFATVSSIEPRPFSETFLRLIYTIIIAPADATFYSSYMETFSAAGAVTPANLLFGALLLAFFLYYSKVYGVLPLYCVPYGIFSLISMNYLYYHHVGTITLFLIFVAWCAKCKHPEPIPLFTSIKDEGGRSLLCHAKALAILVMFAIPISWSVFSAANEINYNFGYGRDAVAYIRQHGLDSGRYSFMVGWFYTTQEEKDGSTNFFESFSQHLAGTTEIAYLEKNIFYNYNDSDPDKTYVTHKLDNSEDTRRRLREYGPPDLYLNDANLGSLWEEEVVNLPRYVYIASFEQNFIYKWGMRKSYTTLSSKETLLEEIGAEAIPEELALWGNMRPEE